MYLIRKLALKINSDSKSKIFALHWGKTRKLNEQLYGVKEILRAYV